MTDTRRRTRRIQQETSVTFRKGENGNSLGAEISNISSGGVFIVTEEKWKHGAILDMEFTVPSRFNSIQARGRVAWHGKQSGQYGMGVEFVEIDPIQLYDLMRGIQEGGWLYALGVLGDS